MAWLTSLWPVFSITSVFRPISSHIGIFMPSVCVLCMVHSPGRAWEVEDSWAEGPPVLAGALDLCSPFQDFRKWAAVPGVTLFSACILSPVRLFVILQTIACPPGYSVHRILQARILEWVAISSSRRSSRPGDQSQVSQVSCLSRRSSRPGDPIPSLLCFPALAASFFTTAPPGKPLTLVRQGGKRISFLQGCPFTPGYLPSGSLGIFTTIWVCHHFSLSFIQTLPWSHLLIPHLPRESQLSEHSPCKILNSTLTGQGQQLHLLFRQTVPSSAKNSHVRKRMMHLTCQWEEDKLRKKLDA